jgi:hypothetical protein
MPDNNYYYERGYADGLSHSRIKVADLNARIDGLVKDIVRLKSGDFTPEELQNLCHSVSETDKTAFFEGCAAYQRKLFGISHVEELKQKRLDAVAKIRKASEKTC